MNKKRYNFQKSTCVCKSASDSDVDIIKKIAIYPLID